MVCRSFVGLKQNPYLSRELWTWSSTWWFQVVKAARGEVPVFLDGGVRRGTDVFKALALGASGIFVSKKNTIQMITLLLSTLWSLKVSYSSMLDWKASGVLFGSRGWGRCEESASDVAWRVRADHGIEWLPLTSGDHPQPHPGWLGHSSHRAKAMRYALRMQQQQTQFGSLEFLGL